MTKDNMVSLHITLDEETKNSLQEKVKADKRFVSVSHFTRTLLDYALKEYNKGNI